MAYTIRGGKIGALIDLTIEGRLPVPREAVTANHESALRRGLPGIEKLSKQGVRLAVVGGGPSIRDHMEELQYWDGDVWAINGAWGWCNEHGIRATFLAIDPHPIVNNWIVDRNGEKPKKSILASCVDPKVFDALSDVTLIGLGGDGLKGGSSTAGITPHLAALSGYYSVTLFGCESSYLIGHSHAYQHEERDEEMIVVADGNEHLTASDYLMQAKELAIFINGLDGYVDEKSGGLLRAWINDLKADRTPWIKWISDGLVKGLQEYKPAAAGEGAAPFSIAAE